MGLTTRGCDDWPGGANAAKVEIRCSRRGMAWLSDSDSDAEAPRGTAVRSPIFSSDDEEDVGALLSRSFSDGLPSPAHPRPYDAQAYRSDPFSAPRIASPGAAAVDDEEIYSETEELNEASTGPDAGPADDAKTQGSTASVTANQGRAAQHRADGERLKRRELARTLQQDALKTARLEQEIFTAPLLRDHGEVAALREQLALELAADQQRIAAQLERLRSSSAALQGAVVHGAHATTPQFVSGLRSSMEQLEAGIASFKQQQRDVYDAMMLAEKAASREVEACERRIEAWVLGEQQTSPARPAPRARHAAAAPSDAPPEVQAFARYVAEHGGASGGWDDYDHGTFMRIRGRLGPAHPRLLQTVHEALPMRTLDEVAAHERWMARYLELQEGRRHAIQAWKERAQQQADQRREQAAQQKQLHEQQQQARADAEAQHREEEVAARRAAIEQWRRQEQDRQRAAELQAGAEAARQREHAARIEAERRTAAHQQLEVVRHQREREEGQRREAEAARIQAELARRKAALVELPAFRARDEEALRERHAREEQQQRERQAREQRLEKLRSTVATTVTATRDPARLLQPTQSTRLRAEDSGEPRGGGRVYIRPPTLGVPAWRKGL